MARVRVIGNHDSCTNAPLRRWERIPGLDLVFGEKRILGSLMGSNAFRVDMPRYVDFYLNGQLLLDEMITARRPLDEINLCFDEMKAGTSARSVIVFED